MKLNGGEEHSWERIRAALSVLTLVGGIGAIEASCVVVGGLAHGSACSGAAGAERASPVGS